MKYNELNEYREYLRQQSRRPATSATVRHYVTRMGQLLKDYNANDTRESLDVSSVINVLSDVKYKSYFSQYKNAFLKFCEFKNIQISRDELKAIESLQEETKKKYKKQNIIDYEKITKRIKRIKNDKLKLSYQVMLCSGVRVSELAQLTPESCTIEKDKIIFDYMGKGNKPSITEIHKINYPDLYETLKNHIDNTEKETTLFYSAVALQRKAHDMGFKCHDLRRMYAHDEYKRTKSKKAVQEKLHHTAPKTTRIYLRSKIK